MTDQNDNSKNLAQTLGTAIKISLGKFSLLVPSKDTPLPFFSVAPWRVQSQVSGLEPKLGSKACYFFLTILNMLASLSNFLIK